MHVRAVLLVFVLPWAVWAQAKPTPEGLEFFEKSIRPILAEHCYSCHGEKKQQAGLRLDNKTDFFKGSDNGPIVVVGEPDKSKLLATLRHTGETKMPPKMKLADPQIAAVAAWIKMGAPFTESIANKETPSPKDHWAFQPVKDPTPPVTRQAVATVLDRFVQAKLEANNLTFATRADQRTLIRRVTYDLTGLLPTPEEIDAFLADSAPNAFEKVVDRLLDSPHYGEHQARHWMDLARYSDTKGYVFTEDRNYPYAYTYRDWLIESFNRDLPYDQFIIQQLAADRIVKDDKKPLAAMGFLTVGRRFLNNIHDIIDDRLDVTFRTFQGMTVGCARCHDHKYDPISIKEYYGLYGVYASSVEPKDLPLIGESPNTPEVQAFNAELKKREQAATDAWERLKQDALKRHRTAESVAAYLTIIRDTRSLSVAQAGTVAVERQLLALMLEHWKKYLDGREAANDPVFAIYRTLGAIADKDFASKAPAELAKLIAVTDVKKVNPLVAQAFKDKTPATFNDVATIYGQLLAKHWPPADKSSPEQAELTAVLGPNGPLGLDDKQVEKIVTIREKNVVRDLRRKAEEWKARSDSAPPRAMVLNDAPRPVEPVVFNRGNPNNRGARTTRQFLSAVTGPATKPFTDGSGRLEMAQAMANPKNPLTARVMVNRIWLNVFGRGLVTTPSDFGLRGEPPSHPELLDWLATRFVESGWSVKKLHKILVLSQTYQQSSVATPDVAKRDPENRLLSHMNRKRLTFEGLRDSLLQASGTLDRRVGGKSVDMFKEPFTVRRTLYGFIDRQNLPGTFRSFDFALPDTHAPMRFTTTVPQQALYLLNSPFVLEQAKTLVARGQAMALPERINELYRAVYGRKPTTEEAELAKQFLSEPVVEAPTTTSVWQYGYGQFDPTTKKVTFTTLPHWTGNAWQGGATLPDAKTGWTILNAQGGHPGKNPQYSVIRRWTAPADGNVSITGTLAHSNKQGDGVRGRIVSGEKMLGEWSAKDNRVSTSVNAVAVKKGTTIDFIVDSRENESFDAFAWAPTVTLQGQGEMRFDATSDFQGPAKPIPPAGSWEQLAQVLLLSNEFAFVD